MFAFSHFEGPLPESFSDFKKSVCDLFPSVYDTQLLARSDVLKLKSDSGEALRNQGSKSQSLVLRNFWVV